MPLEVRVLLWKWAVVWLLLVAFVVWVCFLNWACETLGWGKRPPE
jgi:hypothetical protein